MGTSHIVGWTSASPTPAQLKEFFAQVASGRITKRRLQSLLRSGAAAYADLILGEDFISPDEVAEARGLTYSPAQLKMLTETMPPLDILFWCKTNGFALVPPPPTAMSLLDVRFLKPSLFYRKEGEWYIKAQQKFARDNKTTDNWLMVKKEPVENSTSRTWDQQRELLSEVEYVPNAAEMSWFITTFYEVRGVRLFERIYVRCSDLGSDGLRVVVGHFGTDGLGVSNDWGDVRRAGIAVASARKSA